MAPHLSPQCLACFLVIVLIPAGAGKASSCSARSIDEEIADAHGASLLNVRANTKPASSAPKEQASTVFEEDSDEDEDASEGLGASTVFEEESDEDASEGPQGSLQESPRQLGSGFVDAQSEQVSIELAANVTARYVSALTEAGKDVLGPYLDQFCNRFKVVDPVGTATRRKKWQLKSMFGDRRALIMPEDFVLRHHVTTIAQDHSYTAVSSSMEMMRNGAKYATVNRTDFLTISSLGCVKQVNAYWSLAGSVLKAEASEDHMRTEAAIRNYLMALDELGRNISPAYFHQFTENFEVHDPFGTPPMTSVAELMKAIPNLAALLAPKGFSVTVKAVTVATDPQYGSAHLVLNIVEGPNIDIIDIFKIKNDLVKSLKAVWHIPGPGAPAPAPAVNTTAAPPPTPTPTKDHWEDFADEHDPTKDHWQDFADEHDLK